MKPGPSDDSSLSRLQRIDVLCDEFESRLQRGERPRLEEWVAQAAAGERAMATHELACLEIEYRRAQGESVTLEEYRRRLGATAENLADMFPDADAPTRLTALGSTPDASMKIGSPAELAPLAPGDLLGRYVLIEIVGRGAFGEVWKASDPLINRCVAVKTPRCNAGLTRDDLQRFRAEAERSAQVRHENVVRVFDVGQQDGRPYLVYELIEGASLKDVLSGRRPPLRELLRVFSAVCRAVQAAHENGIVHRDLKPGNILIDRRGAPHVVDFGMAKMPSSDLSVVGIGNIGGTPQYMAPEQLSGEASKSSDVYSLGVILYEILTGRQPFGGSSGDIVQQLLEMTPPAPQLLAPDTPPELEQICLKALAKRSVDRCPSAVALAEQVEGFLEASRSQSPTRLLPAPDVTPRKLPWNVAAAVLLFLVAGAMSAAAWLRPRQAEPGAAMNLGSQVANPGPKASATGPVIHTMRIETTPPGARIVCWGLDPKTRDPDPKLRYEAKTLSPAVLDLAPGHYLVVAVLPDGRFHEVYRFVPTNPNSTPGSHRYESFENHGEFVRWPEITIPEAESFSGMVTVPGVEKFALGIGRSGARYSGALKGFVNVPSFQIDPTEVNWGEYCEQFGAERPATWDSRAMELPDDFPVLVSWGEAVAFAEKRGVRLPTEIEYECVATNVGNTLFPWGDDQGPGETWALGPVNAATPDLTSSPPGIRGLFSNAGEWTADGPLRQIEVVNAPDDFQMEPDESMLANRVVRGFGALEGDSYQLWLKAAPQPQNIFPALDWRNFGVRLRHLHDPVRSRHGFRCARSSHPRT